MGGVKTWLCTQSEMRYGETPALRGNVGLLFPQESVRAQTDLSSRLQEQKTHGLKRKRKAVCPKEVSEDREHPAGIILDVFDNHYERHCLPRSITVSVCLTLRPATSFKLCTVCI